MCSSDLIEIEMTGLSRGKAAETLAGFFGTRAEHTGGSYDAYAVRDAQDRVWKLVSDGSIQTQKKVRGQTVYADSTYLSLIHIFAREERQ